MADEFTKAALYWIKTFNKKVKEKFWIAKLIGLLNEYETPQSWVVFKSYDNYDGTFYWVDCDGETEIAWSDSLICSKKFWFIKWLVENDKIDTSKANDKNLNGYEIELRIRAVKELVADSEEKTVLYLNLLMLLSISDTPIEDLISYLK